MCISNIPEYAIKFDNNFQQYNNSSNIHWFDIITHDLAYVSMWVESLWHNSKNAELPPESKPVCTPVMTLCSLLDKYTYEWHEPSYPSSFELNSITAVLL